MPACVGRSPIMGLPENFPIRNRNPSVEPKTPATHGTVAATKTTAALHAGFLAGRCELALRTCAPTSMKAGSAPRAVHWPPAEPRNRPEISSAALRQRRPPTTFRLPPDRAPMASPRRSNPLATCGLARPTATLSPRCETHAATPERGFRAPVGAPHGGDRLPGSGAACPGTLLPSNGE